MKFLNAINHGFKILKNNCIKSAKLDSEILMSNNWKGKNIYYFKSK